MTLDFKSIDDLQIQLREHHYIADRELATALFLAVKLNRPIFLEGEAGVGKTEVAKVLAAISNTQLIRLQCYEGLDVHHAIYEWNFSRQMLHIRLQESQGGSLEEHQLFGADFLLARPLLQALQSPTKPILLIDEIDRSDSEFEAFLLEILSDFQVTIPEIGTIKANEPPIVVITSNRTRELHDALKRRCIYHWIDYPTPTKELEIILSKVPDAPQNLAKQITAFMHLLRQENLFKLPGVAESLDWINALIALDQHELSLAVINDTLGVVLKNHEDSKMVHGDMAGEIFAQVISGD